MTLEGKEKKKKKGIILFANDTTMHIIPPRQQRHSRKNKIKIKTEADGSLIAVLPPSNMINTQYRPRASGSGLSALSLFHATPQPTL